MCVCVHLCFGVYCFGVMFGLPFYLLKSLTINILILKICWIRSLHKIVNCKLYCSALPHSAPEQGIPSVGVAGNLFTLEDHKDGGGGSVLLLLLFARLLCCTCQLETKRTIIIITRTFLSPQQPPVMVSNYDTFPLPSFTADQWLDSMGGGFPHEQRLIWITLSHAGLAWV